MFSKDYLKYLLKSKKYLLIFILVTCLLNIIGIHKKSDAMYMQCLMSLALTFIIPINVFYHVHDKRAVDTFFAIPVSRRQLLNTGILFSLIAAYSPLLLSIIVYGITSTELLKMFMLIIGLFICCLVLILFNTLIYLIANNAIDGIIMLGAYTVLPGMIYVACSNFVDSYVAGGTGGFSFSFTRFISPVIMSIDNLIKIMDGRFIDVTNYVVMIIIGVASMYLLNREYVQRDVERASTTSNRFFAYPFIIYIYVFICLLLLSSFYNYNYSSFAGYVSETFILYLLLFVVYVIANFIYRRNLYLSYKLPLFFVIAVVVSIFLAVQFKETRGFGLAHRYVHSDKDNYNLSFYASNLSQDYLTLFEENEIKYDGYLDIYVEAGSEKHDKQLDSKTIAILEKYREQGIDAFYEHDNDGYVGNLYVSSLDGERNRTYHYSVTSIPSVDELRQLADDPAVKVILYTGDYQYYLRPDGKVY